MKLVDKKGIIDDIKYNALNYEEQVKYWKLGVKEFKLISEMDDTHLQKAIWYAQGKELLYHNSYNKFFALIQQLENEAERRKLPVTDIDTDFHRNKRKYN